MSASASPKALGDIIDKLARDVEAAVHALYRGDVRQNTVKARTEVHRKAAREAVAQLLGGASGASAPPAATANGAPASLAADEVEALTRCVMAWLPMGAPSAAAADSRCVPAGRELMPSWGEREKARQAARRLSNG
jgi:hypothetical protein